MIAEPFLLNEDCSVFIDNATSSSSDGGNILTNIAADDYDTTLDSLPAKTLDEAQQMTNVRYAFWIMAILMVRSKESVPISTRACFAFWDFPNRPIDRPINQSKPSSPLPGRQDDSASHSGPESISPTVSRCMTSTTSVLRPLPRTGIFWFSLANISVAIVFLGRGCWSLLAQPSSFIQAYDWRRRKASGGVVFRDRNC